MSGEMLHELELSSGRIVLLRSLKVSHYKKAVEAASVRAGNNQTMLAMHSQDEVLKFLLYSIDGKQLDAVQKEQIDTLFDPTEYRQIMIVIEEMVGKAERPKVKMVSISGDK